MPAASYDITIERGADYSLPLVFKDGNGTPLNIIAATFKAQIREAAEGNVILATFTVTVDGETPGRVVISLTGSQTADLDFASGVYDLFMSNAGISYRMVAGNVTITPTVTR
ncbi:MAG: hypothetical protein PW734_06955 [Verrucomicrobium sp.]|nr:hypothetical protein [Verrucomicrobium sp.]